MKKLFISVPMKERTEENIRKSMERMHRIAEAVWEQELEVIPSLITEDPPEGVNKSVWYLGESIKMMADADYFVYTDCLYLYDGCMVERDVARRYKIPALSLAAEHVAEDVYEKMQQENPMAEDI